MAGTEREGRKKEREIDRERGRRLQKSGRNKMRREEEREREREIDKESERRKKKREKVSKNAKSSIYGSNADLNTSGSGTKLSNVERSRAQSSIMTVSSKRTT